MKQIEFNIKKPYTNYFAFKSLRAKVDALFPKFQISDNDQYFQTEYEILRRIGYIMQDLEYYKRGNNHEKFSCNYYWTMWPNMELPEGISIKSISYKEVGTITVKNIEHHDTRSNSI